MLVSKPLDLTLLEKELAASGVVVPGLGMFVDPQDQTNLHTYDANGEPAELPPPATPIVDAHVAPPVVTEFVGTQQVSAIVRTTDATVLEVFRFPCLTRSLYRASLEISGIDAAPAMTSLVQEGRFVWRRATGNAILSGITVVSQIPATIPVGWATNCFVSGTDVIFTVKGPAGTTIDWSLTGSVGRYAPEGLE